MGYFKTFFFPSLFFVFFLKGVVGARGGAGDRRGAQAGGDAVPGWDAGASVPVCDSRTQTMLCKASWSCGEMQTPPPPSAWAKGKRYRTNSFSLAALINMEEKKKPMRRSGRRDLFKSNFLSRTPFSPFSFLFLPPPPNLSHLSRVSAVPEIFISYFITVAGAAAHGDGREDGIAAGSERGLCEEGWKKPISPGPAELIAKTRDKVAGVVREGNWGGAKQEFQLGAAFCRWHLQMGRWPVPRLSPLSGRKDSVPSHTQEEQEQEHLHCPALPQSLPERDPWHRSGTCCWTVTGGLGTREGLSSCLLVQYLQESRVAHVPCSKAPSDCSFLHSAGCEALQSWKMTPKGAWASTAGPEDPLLGYPMETLGPTLILLLLTTLFSGPTDPCQEFEMLNAQILRCAGRAAAC